MSHTTKLIASVMFGGLAVIAPAHSATPKPTVTLCKSFSVCESKGYSTHGYRAEYMTSFWNNTAGHNCTNYVAYMLTHNGRITWRPRYFGDAKTWGPQMQASGATIYATPKPGDVAWWPAYYHQTGKYGHVAMVEKVYSDGSILLSEDSFQDNFYVKRVYRGNSYWPKGFLRFPQASPSPQGRVETATMTNRPGDTFTNVKVGGYTMDPDEPSYSTGANQKLRVTITGTGSTTFSWSRDYDKQWGQWSHSYVLATGTYSVDFWGINQAAGSDALLGTKMLSVSDPTRTAMSLSDYDYRYGGRPYVRGTVTNTADPTEVYPVGTMTVKDGTRTLVTRTVTEANKGVMPSYRLPTLSKGRHTIRVSFVPASSAFKSSTVYKYATVR